MRGKILLAVAAMLVATVAVLFGGIVGRSETGRSAPMNEGQAAGPLLAGFSPGDTAAYVAQLEARVAANPRDSLRLALLGLAYQQRARETGDPSFYPRSEAALRRALRLGGVNALATTGLAGLAASRHRFEEARGLADQARALAPDSAGPLGVLGDALVELGHYRQAFAAFEEMSALKPSLASYSRISYARELRGDPRGAIAAMRLAVEAGTGTTEPAAWALVQLGNLYFETGRLRPAAHSYREALFRFPGYVHAQAALGRVAAARGSYRTAISRYRRAVNVLPLPQYEGALGDVLRLAGRTAEAKHTYAVVDAIQKLLRANGVRTELETALFDLDHGRRLADALSRARLAYQSRRSIEAEDVLAWALYKNGRCGAARSHSLRALRLGTLDALKFFHRGMIELCAGNRPEGLGFLRRALTTNPHFSVLYAPVAEEALR